MDFFVEKDNILEETAEALKERYGHVYMYILGDKSLISDKVEAELAKFGYVQRILGSENIYKQSVGFAGYKDIGKNFGWWISKRNRDFGWGIAEAGHNFILLTMRIGRLLFQLLSCPTRENMVRFF